jgi:hypothetical protein
MFDQSPGRRRGACIAFADELARLRPGFIAAVPFTDFPGEEAMAVARHYLGVPPSGRGWQHDQSQITPAVYDTLTDQDGPTLDNGSELWAGFDEPDEGAGVAPMWVAAARRRWDRVQLLDTGSRGPTAEAIRAGLEAARASLEVVLAATNDEVGA